MITIVHAAILLAAGVLAGIIGSAGGITSLVSYPALLAIGLPARSADIANIVALVGCWPGSALASRPELAGKTRWLCRWTPVAVAGAALGAVLLLITSAHAFARVVPFLVLAAAIALLLEPRLARWRRGRGDRAGSLALPAWLFGLSVYGGYFGAGSGVMILTLLMLLVERHLPRANALKNMLIGASALVSASMFALFAPPNWSAAAALGVGMLAGSSIGPRIARRLPVDVLRVLVALLAIGLAVQLWLDPGA